MLVDQTFAGLRQREQPVHGDKHALQKLRRDAVEEGVGPDGLERALRWYTRLATNPGMWRGATRAGGWGAKLIARQGWIKSLPGRGSAWTEHRDLPAPDARPFHARWNERHGS